MDLMQVTDAELLASEAGEASARSRAASRPVKWELNLAVAIAITTGCEIIFEESPCRAKGRWLFIGVSSREQVARYAMTVLMRQVLNARAAYIRLNLKRCKPASRTRRADTFCLGWVSAMRSKVEPLVIDDRDRQAIDAYKSRFLTETLNAIDRGSAGWDSNDWLNGRSKGESLDLRRPMTGASAPEALS